MHSFFSENNTYKQHHPPLTCFFNLLIIGRLRTLLILSSVNNNGSFAHPSTEDGCKYSTVKLVILIAIAAIVRIDSGRIAEQEGSKRRLSEFVHTSYSNSKMATTAAPQVQVVKNDPLSHQNCDCAGRNRNNKYDCQCNVIKRSTNNYDVK